MSIYYFSSIGTILALVVSCVGLGLFRLIWTRGLNRKWTGLVFIISAAVMLLLPWTEEFWIAHNFGRLCRTDAGLHIARTVDVDGFYDDTTHWESFSKELSGFRFIESRDPIYRTFWRVEREGDHPRHYQIDKPTARYHFEYSPFGSQAGHKIIREESRVIDMASNESIAQFVRYSRQPSWLYIGINPPPFVCDEPSGGPNIHQSLLIYDKVLFPQK